jgi:hypothetical protein
MRIGDSRPEANGGAAHAMPRALLGRRRRFLAVYRGDQAGGQAVDGRLLRLESADDLAEALDHQRLGNWVRALTPSRPFARHAGISSNATPLFHRTARCRGGAAAAPPRRSRRPRATPDQPLERQRRRGPLGTEDLHALRRVSARTCASTAVRSLGSTVKRSGRSSRSASRGGRAGR